MDVGLRIGALVVAGGDLVAERPNAEEEEDRDGTRVCDMPVGEVVVERDARCRGGPIDPSTAVRAGLTVVGVGTLLVAVVVGVVAGAFIRTLLPSVDTRAVVVEGASEVLPALGASLLSSERRDAGRDVWLGGEKVVESRRM